MMSTGRFLLLFFLYVTVFNKPLYSEQPAVKPTTVIGFINKGDEGSDNINVILSKSLIGMLSKVPGSIITPYGDTERAGIESGFWKLKNIDTDLAIQTAQSFDSKQLIVGDYKVNKTANQISINVYVYDVITGDLKLKRNYKGAVGLSLFDTIDIIAKNITGIIIGKKFTLGRLAVKIENSTNDYQVMINGRINGYANINSLFEEEYLSGNEIELSLKISNSNIEVFRKSLLIESDRTNEIKYTPSSIINIKNMLNDGTVLLDGIPVTNLNKEDSFIISNLNPDKIYDISIRHNDKILQKKSVSPKEGETLLVVFAENRGIKRTPFHYTDASPYWDILLPGLTQYQAGDFWMGTLFLSSDVLCLGWTALSIAGIIASSDRYNIAITQDARDKYSRLKGIWQNYTIFGIGAWAGVTIISIVHAYSEITSELKPEQYTFSIKYEPGENIYKICFELAF